MRTPRRPPAIAPWKPSREAGTLPPSDLPHDYAILRRFEPPVRTATPVLRYGSPGKPPGRPGWPTSPDIGPTVPAVFVEFIALVVLAAVCCGWVNVLTPTGQSHRAAVVHVESPR